MLFGKVSFLGDLMLDLRIRQADWQNFWVLHFKIHIFFILCEKEFCGKFTKNIAEFLQHNRKIHNQRKIKFITTKINFMSWLSVQSTRKAVYAPAPYTSGAKSLVLKVMKSEWPQQRFHALTAETGLLWNIAHQN